MKPDFRSLAAVKLRKQMVESISQYQMIEPGDRIMVCVSGGKDSSILLALLAESARRAPFKFEVEGVMLDQKQPGFDASAFQSWVESDLGAKLTILEKDTYTIVKEKTLPGKIYCGLCSRLRRGLLYEHAVKNGFTKLALGHHRDDVAETLLLNLFFSGKISTMPPKFLSDDGRNTVIRPLFQIAESEIQALAEAWKVPTIPCNLCGSQEGLKRKQIKKLITDLETAMPDIRNSMATAITNVRPSHLADEKIWNFAELALEPELRDLQNDAADALSIL